MEKLRIYEIEGCQLQVPLRYDSQSRCYIEEYGKFLERIHYTPAGHPVMFAGEDACPFAQEASPGGCPDCGCCRFYRRAGEHTWIGVCTYEGKKRTIQGGQHHEKE